MSSGYSLRSRASASTKGKVNQPPDRNTGATGAGDKKTDTMTMTSGQSGAGTRASTSKSVPVPEKRKLPESKPGGDGDPKKLKSQMKSNTKKTSEPKSSSSGKGKTSGNIGQRKGRKATSASSAGVPGAVASSVMQNNLILCAIAKKLPARNLLPLRVTSTLWNHTFLPQLALKHKPINLHTTTRRYSDCSLIMDYTNATHIPIRSYKIRNLGIGPEECVKNFFQLRGNIITRLDLELDNLNSATIENFRQIVFEWTPELRELCISSLEDGTPEMEPPGKNQIEPLKKEIPNLRKLTILTDALMYRQYYCLVKDVIQCAVGLEYLTLKDWQHNSYLEKVQLLSVVPGLSRLKGLKVSGLAAEHLRDLIHLSSRQKNPLRLLELEMSTMCSDDGEVVQGASNAEMVELINRFLSTQSNTLRILDIALDVDVENWAAEDDNAGYTPQLPKMDNVQILTLQYNHEWRSVVLPQEETFASNFPGLKRLTFNYDEVLQYTNPDRARHISQFTHEGVTSLKLVMKEVVTQFNAAEAPLLADFSHTWPFVSKLELEIRISMLNSILSSIWTWWPNLVSLRLEQLRNVYQFGGPVKLDEFLSGIPESSFTNLRRRLRAINSTVVTKHMDSLRVLQTEYKTKPGISDLKQLQEFVLDARDHKFRISDIGGYLGFAMMPCQAVQHIALIHRAEARYVEEEGDRQQCKSNLISRPCRNFMRSVIGLNAILDL